MASAETEYISHKIINIELLVWIKNIGCFGEF